MILQNRCKVHHSQIRGSRADSLESSVVWREDSDVLCRIESVDQVRPSQGASCGAKTSLRSCEGNVLGDRQNLVDNVDYSASEVDVLSYVSKCSWRSN